MADEADMTEELIERPDTITAMPAAEDGGVSLDTFWAILDPLNG